MIQENLYLRKANLEDVDLLFEWVNDKCVRDNAFDTHLISYYEHVNWFKRMMNDPDQVQYILMIEDMPVGQIRLSINMNEADIDYSIVSSKRGLGYGEALIKLMLDKIKEDYPDVTKLIGRVKTSNNASMHCFIANGFEESFRQFEFALKE